jgi:arginase
MSGSMTIARWNVIGAPLDCSGRSRGEERAPAALREAGIIERFGAVDLGDVDASMHDPRRDPATGVVGFEALRAAAERIRDRVRSELEAGSRLLVVGGDCTLLLGVMAGVRAVIAAPGLAFVDGHVDFYDGTTSDTGEAADMDLALLTGHGPPGLAALGGAPPIVEPDRIVVIGHRDDAVRRRLGAAEPEEVEPGIALVHARELREGDPAQVGDAARRWLEERASRFWLHLDLDVLDEETFPAVTYPQPGGPGWEALAALLRPLASSPALIGVDVTDLNPDRDPTGEHAARAVEDLARVLSPQ